MPEVEISEIHPLVPEYYLAGLLGASADIAAFCGNRIAVGKDGFERYLFNGEEDKDNWPYILFFGSEEAQQELYADQYSTLEYGEYYIRAFMREDMMPSPGIDIEDFTAIGRRAIDAALQRAEPLSIDALDSAGNPVKGYVSELSILPPIYRALYGETGRKVCEMGRTVRITFS